MRKQLEKLFAFLVDLIDPLLRVSSEYQSILRQREQAYLSAAAVTVPLIFVFVHLNALLFNDAGKTNYSDWLHFRLGSLSVNFLFAIVAFSIRRKYLRLKVTLVALGFVTIAIFSYGMTLGYPFRSQWMSYFSAPVFALTLRSPLLAASCLAGGLFLFRPIWGNYHELRLVMTEYEFTCLFILLGYFWRRLWISKVIAETSLRAAEIQIVMRQQELHTQLRTFIPPVLVRRIEDLHRSGSSIADALDRVLRLRRTLISVLYSDVRDYSRRSHDLSFVESELIPPAAKIVDLAEGNEAIARIVGDGIFCFYESTDPGEALLRSVRDAWICAETEFASVSSMVNGKFSRYFTVTYGDAYVGNIGSKLHKDASVIGKPANIAARLDEMTKQDAVKAWIGARAHVLLSDGALSALRAIHNDFEFETFNLKEHGIVIRSYEDEALLHLLPTSEKNALILGKLLALNSLPALQRNRKLW